MSATMTTLMSALGDDEHEKMKKKQQKTAKRKTEKKNVHSRLQREKRYTQFYWVIRL